jgi:hypothetical protein
MYISTKALATAAALSTGVAADFLVITEYPDALQTMSPEQVTIKLTILMPPSTLTACEQAQSWISENLPGVRSEFLQIATDTSYIAAATSVIPELYQFVATASVSFSFPHINITLARKCD